MSLSPDRNTSGFFHRQWDVASDVRVTLPTGNNAPLRLNFHRVNLIPSWRPYAEALIPALGWLPGDQMAIVGATFGMLEELLRAEHGFVSLASCDDSRWIQAAQRQTEEGDVNSAIIAIGANPFTGQALIDKDAATDGGPRARVEVLNENLLTLGSWNRVKNLLGGQIKRVFTDDLLDFLSDEEALSFSGAVHGYSNNVVLQHAVAPAGSGMRKNAKGAAGWKAALPTDTFVDWATYEVI